MPRRGPEPQKNQHLGSTSGLEISREDFDQAGAAARIAAVEGYGSRIRVADVDERVVWACLGREGCANRARFENDRDHGFSTCIMDLCPARLRAASSFMRVSFCAIGERLGHDDERC